MAACLTCCPIHVPGFVCDGDGGGGGGGENEDDRNRYKEENQQY